MANYGNVPPPSQGGGGYGALPPAAEAGAGGGGYGAIPPNQQAGSGAYGVAPGPNTNNPYGATPPPAAQAGGGGYGQTPPPPAGGNNQYGAVIPPASGGAAPYGGIPTPAGGANAYGNVPPVNAGNYGQTPPPANGAYGQTPPAAYGQTPPVVTGPNGIIEDFRGQAYWRENLTRPSSEVLLAQEADMTAILRPSSRPGKYTVSYKKGAEILHTNVECELDHYVVVDAEETRQKFTTMDAVFKYLKVKKYQDKGGAVAAPQQQHSPTALAGSFDYSSWDPNGDVPPPPPGDIQSHWSEHEHQLYFMRKRYWDMWVEAQQRKHSEAQERIRRNQQIINGVWGAGQ